MRKKSKKYLKEIEEYKKIDKIVEDAFKDADRIIQKSIEIGKKYPWLKNAISF